MCSGGHVQPGEGPGLASQGPVFPIAKGAARRALPRSVSARFYLDCKLACAGVLEPCKVITTLHWLYDSTGSAAQQHQERFNSLGRSSSLLEVMHAVRWTCS